MPHDITPRNFPSYPTRFIGRDKELAEIAARLMVGDCRLLTLVGPGGIGKSRLAFEVARQHEADFEDGVYLVELAPLESPDALVPAIAAALNFQFIQVQPSLDSQTWTPDTRAQLIDYLRDKHLLLVLDNYEHLLPEVNLVEAILTAAPHVYMVITSREVLNLEWEMIYDVPGMNIPAADEEPDPQVHSAIQLFVDRAQRSQHHFSLQENPACIARICQLVDGMPLGIELAASWLRVLPCDDLAERLEHSLAFLTSRQRAGEERHNSLRTVFDHSWRLLDEVEQDVLMRLSVFRGSFSAEAAEAISGAALDRLSILIDKSLLRMAQGNRYDLHELVRQLATEKLDGYPQAKADATSRHCTYYLTLLAGKLGDLKGRRQGEAVRTIEANIDNIRAAWQWAVYQGDYSLIAQAEEPLYYFYLHQARHSEGESIFGWVVESGEFDEKDNSQRLLMGKLLARQGIFYYCDHELRRDPVFDQIMERSLTLLRPMNETRALAFCLDALAYGRIKQTQDPQALDEFLVFAQESLSLYRGLYDSYGLATVLRRIGYAFMNSGRYVEAQPCFEESLTFADATGNAFLRVWALDGLGGVSHVLGQADRARKYAETCLTISRDNSIRDGMADSLARLSTLAEQEGNHGSARDYALQMLDVARRAGFRQRIRLALRALAWVEYRLGQFEEAQDRAREVLAEAEISGDPETKYQALLLLGAASSMLGDPQSSQRWSEAALALAREGNNQESISSQLSNLGFQAFLRGDYAEARTLCQDSLTIRETLGTHPGTKAATLANLGHAAAGLGEETQAKQSYREGMLLAQKHGAIPIVLEAAAGLTRYLAAAGELEYAVELLSMVVHHPSKAADVRPVADPLLVELQAELPPDVFAAAQNRGKRLDLAAEVDKLLAHPALAVESRAVHPTERLVDQLSERELEILRMVARGRSNRQIAHDLFLALGTVKTHLHNICGKLNAQNRTEAVAHARDLHLLDE